MKFTLALAAAGLAAALPGGGGDDKNWGHGGGKGGWGNKMTTSCYHTSTCKAVYNTKSSLETSPVYVPATKTVYKPVTVTTEVPQAYTKTEYGELQSRRQIRQPLLTTSCAVTKYTTSESVYTVTSTKHEKVETSKVVCKTYPSYYFTDKEYPVTSTKHVPQSSVETNTYPATSNSHKVYTTSTPYPETYKSKSETVITKYVTATENKCYPTEACTTMKKGWGGYGDKKHGGGW